MFTVYESGYRADNSHPVLTRYGWFHPDWAKCSFDSLDEAIRYAKNWANGFPYPTKVEKVDMTGYGDILEIREE